MKIENENDNLRRNDIPMIISKNEAVLFEDSNVILKTSLENSESISLSGAVQVTSKQIKFIFNNDQFIDDMFFNYSEISFHALSKESGYVMIQFNLKNDVILKNNLEFIKKDDKLFVFTSDNYEALNLFDQISTGSSLNPDLQIDNVNIDYQGMNKEDLYIEVDDEESDEFGNNEDTENNQMDCEIIQETNSYQPYDYSNSIDKIFKTEKKKRDISDRDPRRFEDADL